MPNRTVVLIARGEFASLAAKQLQGTGGGIDQVLVVYNATLDMRDENGTPMPYLAESLPQLNSDSWRVFPDGRMETRYRLKPNLVWHDGAPLSPEDFIFAWKVYATPAFGTSGPPIGYMEEVTAPDPRTIAIRWRQPYPEAGFLDRAGFPPLPRHVLEPQFRELDPQAFAAHRFWTQEYVGLGPYQLERFEPGAAVEAVAFDQHVLGRPKIDRLRIVFIGDTNTVMANMLAGEAHYVTDFVLGSEEGIALEREWSARGLPGVVYHSPSLMRLSQVQLKPELSNPPLLRDVRVRKALAYGIDNDAALETITYGKGKIAVVPVPGDHDFWPVVDVAVPRYRYDPPRARQQLEEAGLVRGPDGVYQTPDGQPFRFDYGFILQANNERENAIFVDSLRRVGVAASPRALSSVELRDPQARISFPALFTSGAANLLDHTRTEIPEASNRWQGKNRGGWTNPEFDRLKDAFDVTLEPAERSRLVVQMSRIFADELPGIPHYLTTIVNAWSGNLEGVAPKANPNAIPLWHVYKWEWRVSIR
jgi:peptide/nickel transport system substrate-binding protein